MENQNRVAKVLLLLAGLFLVLCVGMAIGGVLVYGVTRIADARSQARVESFDLQFGDQPQRPLRQEVAPGARIVEVMPDSPAERAGLQVGDTILAVDRQRVGLVNDLADLIAAYEPGDRVTLVIQSPGQDSRRVQVKLGENPDRQGAPYLGVRYSSAQPNLAPQGEMLPFDPDQLPMPRGRGMQGVVVVEVTQDSPAAAAGLQPGDAITAIDGEAVDSAQALVDAIEERKPGEQVKLSVFRFFGGPGSEGGALPPGFEFGQGTFHLEVPLGEMPFHLDELPLDQLPFHMDELPGDWKEFHRQFEFHGAPGSDDNSL
jgi:S1-C subfamily serine protease